MLQRPAWVLTACLAAAPMVLTGCAAQRRAEYQAAIASENPPPDFWLSVAVLRAPADTASRAAAYQRLPVGVRPARYIVEADRVLHVAVGSGASEATYPPETRRLTEAEFTDLWNRVRSSPLGVPDNPAEAGRAPTLGEIGERTVYVVSFSGAGDRRVIVLDSEPADRLDTAAARGLVERLAALAWMK